MSQNEKIGIFIMERRKKIGLTQLQIAQRLDVSVQAVSKWETGASYPNIELLLCLAELLGITVDELLSGTCFDKNRLVFHLADENDIDALVETRIEVLRAANQLRPDIDMAKIAEESRTYFVNGFRQASFLAYLVTDRDRIVGTGGVSFFRVMPTYHNPTGQKAYIMNMYTHPDYRRKGIGMQTLDKLAEEIKKRKIPSVSLEATEMGRPLYVKYGFTAMKNEMELIL